MLMASGVFAWVQTFRSLEFEPKAVQAAQQIASLVNLSRAALRYADSINRVTLIKTIFDQESVRLKPREPTDHWEPFEVDRFTRAIGAELRSRLGPDTIVASTVNGTPGLWVGFVIENDNYWLQADPSRVQPLAKKTWFIWVGIALVPIAYIALADLNISLPAGDFIRTRLDRYGMSVFRPIAPEPQVRAAADRDRPPGWRSPTPAAYAARPRRGC